MTLHINCLEGTTPWTGIALVEIMRERLRQDAKWGEQRDITNILPDLHYEILPADYYKQAEQLRAKVGHSTWVDILLEEVAEAVDEAKSGDLAALRKELIQVAAVAVNWVENLDRRDGKAATTVALR